VPFRKRTSSVLDEGRVGDPAVESDIADIDDVLARAEEAEAEAAEAEALASAARARARALRLRREAQAASPKTPEGAREETPAETDVTDATEVTDEAEVTADAGDPSVQDAAGEPPAPAPTRSRPRRVPWKAIGYGAAALVTIALLVVSVLMVVHHRQAQAEQQRAAEFAAAARQGVVTLMSLNFSTAKDDVQRIIDNAAGQFKEDFEASAEDFATVAERSKVVTEANVNATAVQSMTDNSAVVLVAATSRITNETGAKQDPRTWRLIVDVVRDGDRIKMSKVEFAP
jgi:Mce-associated membrane protein